VMFHLIGALPEFGKVGALCVGNSYKSAERWYRATVDTLARATGASTLRRAASQWPNDPVRRPRTPRAGPDAGLHQSTR
jgi:hypothetical protein